MTEQSISKQDIQSVFKSFDKDNSGFIDLKEIQQVVEELGEKMDARELEKAVKDMDTNKDGKISFDEFEYWWTHAKKGKLKNIVRMRFRALKWINKASVQLNPNGVSLVKQYSKQSTSHLITASLGEQDGALQIDAEVIMGGIKFKEEIAKKQQLQSQISKKDFALILTIGTKDPGAAKDCFDKFISFCKSNKNEDTLTQELIQLFQITSIVKQNHLIMIIESSHETVKNAVGDLNEEILKLGKQFSLYTNVVLRIKSSILDAFNNIKFVKWLSQGVSAKIKVETNAMLLKEIRSILQNSLGKGNYFTVLLTMLHASKLHFKLKGPQDISKLFKSLGIDQLSEETPHIHEIVNEIAQNLQLRAMVNPAHKQYPLFKLLEFFSANADDKVVVEVLTKQELFRVSIKAEGGSQIFRRAFGIAAQPK